MKRFLVAGILLGLLCGCEKIPVETAYGNDITILEPVASGEIVYTCEDTTIDASNVEDGYVMIKNETSEKKLKIRILHEEMMYTYDLQIGPAYDVYPLQMGNGEYEIRVYENTQGNNYKIIGVVNLDVQLKNENVVFLYPNQYVWYTNYDHAVELSFALCEDAQTDEEKVQIIYEYVVSHMRYDKEKASSIKNGYLPDVDAALEEGKGICFDYAAIMGAMLRAQEIPTRLVTGNVVPEYVYHAWNQVYLDEKWIGIDATFHDERSEDAYTETKRF